MCKKVPFLQVIPKITFPDRQSGPVRGPDYLVGSDIRELDIRGPNLPETRYHRSAHRGIWRDDPGVYEVLNFRKSDFSRRLKQV